MGKSVSFAKLSQNTISFDLIFTKNRLFKRGDKYRDATDGKKDAKKDLNELKQELAMDEHQISLDELYARLGTNPDTGLTSEQAK